MLVASTRYNVSRLGSLVACVSELAGLGFPGVELAAGCRVEDALDAAELCRTKRVSCPTVAAPLGEPAGDLSSPDEGLRRRAVSAVLAALPAAAAARAHAIVIRLGEVEVADPAERRAGRDRHLDAAARSLFELTRAEPEVTFSLRTPEGWRGLPDPEELELLIEDAGPNRVGYTHDVAAASRLAEEGVADAAAWLARHGPRAVSVVLHDRMGEISGLPPGDGQVDWPLVAAEVTSALTRVLEIDPSHPPAALPAAAARLTELGL